MKTKQMKNQEMEGEKQMKQSKINERGLKEGKMKRLSENGITLVALVVTIIIMLILAGVAISLALGENGLFSMSRNATGKYKEAEANESRELDKVNNDISNIIESLEGKKSDAIEASEIAKDLKKYSGQYVNYGVDLDGNSETSDWKLFYVGGSDKDDSPEVQGRIYLIAADYVPMENSTLKGAMGDGTSKAMMKPATSSRHGTLSANWPSTPAYQDLTELKDSTGLSINPIKLFMHEGYDISSKSGNPNSAATSRLLNTDNWSGFAGGEYGYAAIGGPTLEMWCKAWNQVVDETDTTNNLKKMYANGDNTSGNGYYWGTEPTTKNKTYMYMNGTTSPMEDLAKLGADYSVFFPHTTSSVTANGATGSCNGYWLASPSAYDADYVMYVAYNGGVNGSIYNYANGIGLRPVVCLQSEVKLQKNTAKSDDTKTVYDIVQ